MPTLAFSKNEQKRGLAEASDRDLLQQIRGSDELALDELIRRKTGVLVQVAYRILGDLEESKDVVQLAFLRVWENRSRYLERWSPNTWIYRIVTNLSIDHLRSRQSRDRIAEPLRLHLERRGSLHGVRAAEHLGEREVHGIFYELAASLTEKQRAVFVLREVEGRSSAEVAEILECRESTVRNHLFNARKVLRVELLQRYPEYAPSALRANGSVVDDVRVGKDADSAKNSFAAGNGISK